MLSFYLEILVAFENKYNTVLIKTFVSSQHPSLKKTVTSHYKLMLYHPWGDEMTVISSSGSFQSEKKYVICIALGVIHIRWNKQQLQSGQVLHVEGEEQTNMVQCSLCDGSISSTTNPASCQAAQDGSDH